MEKPTLDISRRELVLMLDAIRQYKPSSIMRDKLYDRIDNFLKETIQKLGITNPAAYHLIYVAPITYLEPKESKESQPALNFIGTWKCRNEKLIACVYQTIVRIDPTCYKPVIEYVGYTALLLDPKIVKERKETEATIASNVWFAVWDSSGKHLYSGENDLMERIAERA
jgi:hypothetical protein